MTRAKAYAEGWHEGRRWAETDIRDGQGAYHHSNSELREAATTALVWARGLVDGGENWAAQCLGRARGYRQTVADFASGHVTPEMFEHAPGGPR